MVRNFSIKKLGVVAIAIAVLGFAGFALVTNAPTPAVAQGGQIFLDWSDGPGNCQYPFPIPPFCATWHEISPVFCNNYHQDNYSDNGDGYVSPCDIIILNGIPYHVDSASQTVYLDCDPGAGELIQIVEPVNPAYGGDPYDTQWFSVYPVFGTISNVDGWNDVDANGNLSVCDYVLIGGQECHVKRIGCNIRVSPVGTATEPSTWGTIKGIFGF